MADNRDPMLSGLAQGVAAMAALNKLGIFASGWFWRWRPGVKGGVFEPHLNLNGVYASDVLDFGSMPQGDVNGDYCECQLQTVFRDERGRFAKNPIRRDR